MERGNVFQALGRTSSEAELSSVVGHGRVFLHNISKYSGLYFFDVNLEIYAGLIQEEKAKETKSTESQCWIWEKLKSIF